MWTEIDIQISQVTGQKFETQERHSVSGGCINQGYCLANSQSKYFVKLNRTADLSMFTAEFQGLQAMGQTRTIRVPQPICTGVAGDYAYLVLEWIDFGKSQSDRAWSEMGHQLAMMHQHESAHRFGWDQNNTIGSTLQINTWNNNWADFWTESRIGYQLKLAKRKGGYFPEADLLLVKIKELLEEHQPQPALVHGDLWGGNAAITVSGEPIIFDPANYFGDREVDLAMTELFGGFPSAFYRSYHNSWSLDPGYERRKSLYNLYHILNHFNLFGGGYANQANQMISQILHR